MRTNRSALQSYTFTAPNYDLATTLTCGQAFRWQAHRGGWNGVVHDHWIIATQTPNGLKIETTHPTPDWTMLAEYFQVGVNLQSVIKSFPSDPHINRALKLYPGLRLLKQAPWECLASFILSSTKQIPHIQKIIQRLAFHHGRKLPTPPGAPSGHTFPTAKRLATLTESDLRQLGMGYRARYLSQTAKLVDSGEVDLPSINKLSYPEAKQLIQQFPGVGPKIADCVLLFAFGKQEAFPVDVWVRRALTELYFPGSKPSSKQLAEFVDNYFGENAGYAQQYLFHYMRTQNKRGSKQLSTP